jgi:hypothetical protein
MGLARVQLLVEYGWAVGVGDVAGCMHS